ncbi:MAG: hypothetical protein C0183_17390 [Roseiflexus castenholzii]|uniref:glucoamylase family protein n=1 Tax=Roseiflexus castenholzii TaxID=120962 RepID=UPI000CBC7FFF|nr:MAG: hypothetical protein C0183_17390 [Roseiflexus castenholzii]
MNILRSVVMLVGVVLLSCASVWNGIPFSVARIVPSDFRDDLARDTWTYLRSSQATTHHLPSSWWSPAFSGGDYANPTEIGLYALSWIAAHDMKRPWSPSWSETEAEAGAVLDQLRAWQTGVQTYQPHGPNAYQKSVFYQWYWIGWDPPVVGANIGDNHLVPSVDNAWLAMALITIREYAEAHGRSFLAQKADAILADMDFSLWYNPVTHRFFWGDVENPQGGIEADFYSNENRIINFVSRALGQMSADEFLLSLAALQVPSGDYDGIVVARVAWDGSYFTYAAPALFIREMDTAYGRETLLPVTRAQIAYARNQGYAAWGLSDCFSVGTGGYEQQGAPPVASPTSPESQPGLVTPHAAGLALITPLAEDALHNLQTLRDTFPCIYRTGYGFREAVMARPGDGAYGQCSDRYSTLAQTWLFLSLVNSENGFIWRYFYRDPGVLQAHIDMYGESRIYLPLVRR